MKSYKLATIATICAGSLCFNSPRASAQDDGPPPPPPEAPAAPAAAATPEPPAAAPAPGGPGGDRMEQFRQRMNEQIKTRLQANDQEWAVIQPLLEKVQEGMRQTMLGRFGGGMRPPRGGGNGGGNDNGGGPRPERADRANRPDRPPQVGDAESKALQEALENPATSNTEIKAKLEALREARKKAQADLEKSRADLKSVLSLHQEATLVMMGMLD